MNETFILRNAHKNEINNWDLHVLQNKYEAGFLQSKAYAVTKESFGWRIRYVVYENRHEKIYSYFLEKEVLTLGYLWYIPSGSITLKTMDSVLRANKEFIRQHKLPVFVIKMEPNILDAFHSHQALSRLGLLRTRPIQAHSSTILLDLTADLPESLGTKARRDIRLVAKQSIEVRHLPFSEDVSQTMYSLMKTVNRGRGSAFIRPYSYYRTFWKNFSEGNSGDFYFAYEDSRPVVGAFIINFGRKAIYKDGGSTPGTLYKKRYSMAVQWQALQYAKQYGNTSYDLCGTPPRQELHNPLHPYYGIGQFKLKFKKETTEYCGCYDQILKTFPYRRWKAFEKIIYRLHFLKNNDLFF